MMSFVIRIFCLILFGWLHQVGESGTQYIALTEEMRNYVSIFRGNIRLRSEDRNNIIMELG